MPALAPPQWRSNVKLELAVVACVSGLCMMIVLHVHASLLVNASVMCISTIATSVLWFSRFSGLSEQSKAEADREDLRTVLANLSEPVVAIKNHVIQSVNDAAVQTFGYDSKDDLIGQNVSILMNDQEAAIHHTFIHRYEKTLSPRIIGVPQVVTGKHRDGTKISVTLSISPSRSPGEYIGILYQRTDVLARAKAEADREDLRFVLENLAEPVVSIKKHVIQSVNDAAVATFGYGSREELVGKNVSVLMNAEDASIHHTFIQTYEETGVERIIAQPRVVRGRHRDGSTINVTLSVSPSRSPGHYIGILYRRTDAEARLRAEAAEAKAKTEKEVLALQLENLKMQLQQLNSQPAQISRNAQVVQAWTREWLEPSDKAVAPSVDCVCIAASTENGHDFKGRIMADGELGEEINIIKGSHAFVKVLDEPFLRITPFAGPFGGCHGHTQLACEQPVLYAGELEFGSDGELLRWCNLSGTYQPDDDKCYQTGLPLDSFWACTTKEFAERLDPDRVNQTSNGHYLYRVLSCSDDLFRKSKEEWHEHVANLRSNDEEAEKSFQKVQQLSEERAAAVTQFGYLSTVSHSVITHRVLDAI